MMERVYLLLILRYSFVSSKEDITVAKVIRKADELQTAYSDKVLYQYLPPTAAASSFFDLSNTQQHYNGFHGYVPPSSSVTVLPSLHKNEFQGVIDGNPLFAALLLSVSLGLTPKSLGVNHPEHLPVNPYVTLLLSQYGRYLPIYGKGHHGLYSYAASNNYHNNKPFGSYKIYEETDG